MKPESFEFQPMEPVEPLLPPNLLWLWIGLAVLFVALIAIYLLRRTKTSSTPVIREEQAYNFLIDSIETKIPPPDHPREHATVLSIELRRYLTVAFSDPLLFETNEERRLDTQRMSKVSEELRQRIDQHLDTLETLQYRKTQETGAAHLVTKTRELAQLVHQSVSPRTA